MVNFVLLSFMRRNEVYETKIKSFITNVSFLDSQSYLCFFSFSKLLDEEA